MSALQGPQLRKLGLGPLPALLSLMPCVGIEKKKRLTLKKSRNIIVICFLVVTILHAFGSRVKVVHNNMWCHITALRPDYLDKAVSHAPCPHRVFIMPGIHFMGSSILISKTGNPLHEDAQLSPWDVHG